jgi:uncharacterized protein
MEARKKRIEELDILRGFALFGVLLVNLTMMHTSRVGFSVSRMDLEGMNRLSALAIEVFFQGKFYTSFSILFGLGFFLFMNRTPPPSTDGTRLESPPAKEMSYYFIRRMLVLLAFGMIHMVFVWHGDILHTYAVIGLILLYSGNVSEQRLLRRAVFWLLIAALFNGFFSALIEETGLFQGMLSSPRIPYADEIYSQGSYLALLRYRLVHEVQDAPANLLLLLPKILGLFYLGCFLGQKGVFQNLKIHRAAIGKVFRYSAFSSLLLILLTRFFALYTGGATPYYTFAFLEGALGDLLTVSGSLFYMSGLLILLGYPRWKKVLRPLRYMGRMALTNYLMQTVFWSVVFNGYGLGLYGKLPYWSFFPLATGFFILQLFISKWWLARRKNGPMEAFWRKLTYQN